ncbi:hypothetical protein D9M68_543980 [compost metagenome]
MSRLWNRSRIIVVMLDDASGGRVAPTPAPDASGASYRYVAPFAIEIISIEGFWLAAVSVRTAWSQLCSNTGSGGADGDTCVHRLPPCPRCATGTLPLLRNSRIRFVAVRVLRRSSTASTTPCSYRRATCSWARRDPFRRASMAAEAIAMATSPSSRTTIENTRRSRCRFRSTECSVCRGDCCERSRSSCIRQDRCRVRT